ncbi:hypothetical protein [Sphingomonas sp. HMP6]|nr:hypothetical protein [Sphingomonas sp. HMP6]
MDDEPRWRQTARALEYWAIAALVAGSMIYGLAIAAKDVIASIL